MDSYNNIVPQGETTASQETAEEDHSRKLSLDTAQSEMDIDSHSQLQPQASPSPAELTSLDHAKETSLIGPSVAGASADACHFEASSPNQMAKVSSTTTSICSSSNLSTTDSKNEKMESNSIASIQGGKHVTSLEMKQEEEHVEKEDKEKASIREEVKSVFETDDHSNPKDNKTLINSDERTSNRQDDNAGNIGEKASKENESHLGDQLKQPIEINAAKNTEGNHGIETVQRGGEKHVVEACDSYKVESKEKTDLTNESSRKIEQENIKKDESVHGDIIDNKQERALGTDCEKERSQELVVKSNSSELSQTLSFSGTNFRPMSERESKVKVEEKTQTSSSGDVSLSEKCPGNIDVDGNDIAESDGSKDSDQRHLENLQEQDKVPIKRGRKPKPRTDVADQVETASGKLTQGRHQNQVNKEQTERKETRRSKNLKEKEEAMRNILKTLSNIPPSEFYLPPDIIGNDVKAGQVKVRKILPVRAAANRAEGSYYERKKSAREADDSDSPPPADCQVKKPTILDSDSQMKKYVKNRKLAKKYKVTHAKHLRRIQHSVFKTKHVNVEDGSEQNRKNMSMDIEDGSNQRNKNVSSAEVKRSKGKKSTSKCNRVRKRQSRLKMRQLERMRQMRFQHHQKKDKRVPKLPCLTTSLGRYWEMKHKQRHHSQDDPESQEQSKQQSDISSHRQNENQTVRGRRQEGNVCKMSLRKNLKRPRDSSEYPRTEFSMKRRKLKSGGKKRTVHEHSSSLSGNALIARRSIFSSSYHRGRNLDVSMPSSDSSSESDSELSDATLSAFDTESYINSNVGSPEIEIDVDVPSDYSEHAELPQQQQIPDPDEDQEGLNVSGNSVSGSPAKTVQPRKLPIHQRKLPNPSSDPVAVFYYNSEATMLRRCSKHHPCCQMSATAAAKVDSWTQWEDPDKLQEKSVTRRKSKHKTRDDLSDFIVPDQPNKSRQPKGVTYRKNYSKRWFTSRQQSSRKDSEQTISASSSHVTEAIENTSSSLASSNLAFSNSSTPPAVPHSGAETQTISTLNSFRAAAVPNLTKTQNSVQRVSPENPNVPSFIHGLFTGSSIAIPPQPQQVHVRQSVLPVTSSPSTHVNSSAVAGPSHPPQSSQLQAVANVCTTALSEPATVRPVYTIVTPPSCINSNASATTPVSSISTLAMMTPADIPQTQTQTQTQTTSAGIPTLTCPPTGQTVLSHLLKLKQTQPPNAAISVQQLFLQDGGLWLKGERNGKPIVRKVGTDKYDYVVMKRQDGGTSAVLKISDNITNPRVKTVSVPCTIPDP